MVIIILQVAAFVMFVWLLRDSPQRPVPQERPERIDRGTKH
jgi:hypothetical protein